MEQLVDFDLTDFLSEAEATMVKNDVEITFRGRIIIVKEIEEMTDYQIKEVAYLALMDR